MPIQSNTPADLVMRAPQLADGPALAALIRACPPLDANSTYAYLLLCRDFAATCAVVVGLDGKLAGAVTGYRPPERSEVLFIWQVAVATAWRGRGLASALLDHLLSRSALADVTHVETTIGPDNHGSEQLFHRLARRRGSPLTVTPLFDASHLGASHAAELLHRIGPFARSLSHV